MNRTPRRIHIIGGPGSGKTTLARQLGAMIEVPCYDLDEIGYVDGAGAARPLADRLCDVARIAADSTWVTEGAFLWWPEELFRTADVIVWLDLPLRILAWRIPLRHLKAELAGTNRHPGWRQMWRLVRMTYRYHRASGVAVPRAPDDDAAISRQATRDALQPYMAKVVQCHHARDVRRCVRVMGIT